MSRPDESRRDLSEHRHHGPLAGKVALVTGGGRGIGAAIVARLAEDGADLAVCDVDEAQARAVAKRVAETSDRRAIAVAVLISPRAPFVTSPKTISSATRPPMPTASPAMSSFLRFVYLSSSGSHIVEPRDGPRGMIVTLWSGSVCGSNSSSKAWPASW